MHTAPMGAQRMRCAALMALLLLAPAAAQVGSTVEPATVPAAAAAGAVWHDLPPFIGAQAVLGRNGTGADSQIAVGGQGTANWTVLSTGRAQAAGTARATTGPGTDHGAEAHGVHDPVTLAWDLQVPGPHDCLFVHFRLLTDQWPPAAHPQPDGMVLAWGADGLADGAAGFATEEGAGLTTGSAQVDAAGAAGTGFVAGTPTIVARTPVAVGPGRLFASVYDGGHGGVDSALIVDGIETFHTGSAGAGATGLDACTPGPVALAPGAAFSWTPERPGTCEEVRFSAPGAPRDAAAAWDFRDGHGSPLEDPVHRFGRPGVYPVTRVVSGPGDEVRIHRADVHVEGACPIEARPGGPWRTEVGTRLRVAGTGSGGIAPYTCAWSGAEPLRLQGAGDCEATLRPRMVGTFTLRLDVVDAAGNQASDHTTVHVRPHAQSDPDRPRPPPDQDGPSDTTQTSPTPAPQPGPPPGDGGQAGPEDGGGPPEPVGSSTDEEEAHGSAAPRLEREAVSVQAPPGRPGGFPWLAILLMTAATAGTGAIVIAVARRGSGGA